MRKGILVAASIIVALAIAFAIAAQIRLPNPAQPPPIQPQTTQTQTFTQTKTQTPRMESIEIQGKMYDYEIQTIALDNVTITVEIADDSEKIERGLMFRESLPEDRGMLFTFDREHKYQFWMMNMKINLDMIWLDSNGKVVYIVEDAEPCIDASHTSMCTFNPDEPALYVLEVNSGFVKKHNINENSMMRILT